MEPGKIYLLDDTRFRCVRMHGQVGVFEKIDAEGNVIVEKTGPYPTSPSVRRYVISNRLGEMVEEPQNAKP